MQKIYAIHGAYSSPLIFNYLKSKMVEYDWIFFDYSEQYKNIEDVVLDAEKYLAEDCHIIGHSLGGLIGMSLAMNNKVRSITIIASPINGIDNSIIHNFLPYNCFIREITEGSRFIGKIHSHSWNTPILQIKTNRGYNPFLTQRNDGVITITSQEIKNDKLRKATKTVDMPMSHNEAMLSDMTIKEIVNFIKKD
jgi:pimeloyl-ACP methyl ester carboxylesterase